jgi:Flp pilus assembly protein TadG
MKRLRLVADRRGATALEFALAGGVTVLLLMGTIELGLLWWDESGLEVAAAATARCTALGSCADPAAFAVSTVSDWTATNLLASDGVEVRSGVPCPSGNGTSTFATATLTSSSSPGGLVPPFSGMRLSASACFPLPP